MQELHGEAHLPAVLTGRAPVNEASACPRPLGHTAEEQPGGCSAGQAPPGPGPSPGQRPRAPVHSHVYSRARAASLDPPSAAGLVPAHPLPASAKAQPIGVRRKLQWGRRPCPCGYSAGAGQPRPPAEARLMPTQSRADWWEGGGHDTQVSLTLSLASERAKNRSRPAERRPPLHPTPARLEITEGFLEEVPPLIGGSSPEGPPCSSTPHPTLLTTSQDSPQGSGSGSGSEPLPRGLSSNHRGLAGADPQPSRTGPRAPRLSQCGPSRADPEGGPVSTSASWPPRWPAPLPLAPTHRPGPPCLPGHRHPAHHWPHTQAVACQPSCPAGHRRDQAP